MRGEEASVDLPAELRYTKSHEWVRIEEGIVTVGITDYAQGELGDIVFVELLDVGTEATQDTEFGTIEAVKTVADLFFPVGGKIVGVNDSLQDAPEKVNEDPYGEGWMVKIEVADAGELDRLLPASEYRKLTT